MNYGIFAQLGTEDNEAQAPVQDNILDDIAHEEAYADVLAIEASINTDVAAMAQAESAAARMEAQIGHESAMVATPEVVTPSVVALATESLATTAMLLGAPVEAVVGTQLGTEAIEANPVSALKLGTEAKESFLKKIINSIKAIFKKVMNSAKKLYAKLVVAMDGTAKTADKLIKHIEKNMKDATADKKVLEEKDGKKVYNMTGIDMEYKVDKADVPSVVDAVKSIVDAYNEYAKLDEKADEAAVKAASDKVASTTGSAIDKIKSANVPADKLVSEFGFDAPDAKDGKYSATVTSFAGTKARIICAYVTNDDKAETKLVAKSLTYDISNKDFAKVDVKAIADIKTGLESVKTDAKETPKFKDQVMKAIEGADKALDKMAKSEAKGDSKIGYMVNKLKAGGATATRDLTVTVLLNVLLDHVKQNKAKLSSAKIHLGYYSTPTADM